MVLYEVDSVIVKVEVNKDFMRRDDLEAAKREMIVIKGGNTVTNETLSYAKRGALTSEARGRAKKVVDLRTL